LRLLRRLWPRRSWSSTAATLAGITARLLRRLWEDPVPKRSLLCLRVSTGRRRRRGSRRFAPVHLHSRLGAAGDKALLILESHVHCHDDLSPRWVYFSVERARGRRPQCARQDTDADTDRTIRLEREGFSLAFYSWGAREYLPR